MRLPRKSPITLALLSLSLGVPGTFTAAAQANIGALHIGPGTTWVSTPDTYVVLDRTDLQYDADPSVLLNNVFRFTGTGINSIRGATRPLLYAIGVAKVDAGGLWLNQAVTIAQRVNFETGFFNLNGNALFLQPDALFTNEHEKAQLVGNFGGYVTIDADLHAGTTTNPGNLGAIITTATDLGKVTISRSHETPRLDTIRNGIDRLFNIVPPVGTAVNATLRFYYLGNEAEGFPPDSLHLWQSPDETPWSDIGYTFRDASQLYVEKQGLTSLGRFTLSLPGDHPITPPPPPTGTSGPMLLTGLWIGSRAQLNWTITAEYQDQLFNVERKYSTQSDFSPVATLPTKATGGNSSTAVAYSYLDSTVSTGPDDITYRIRRVGTEAGDFSYSNSITLKATDSASGFIHKIYPTIVVGGRVYIEAGNLPLNKIAFAVIDSKGSIVLLGELPYQSQWLPVDFPGKGVYRLLIQSPGHKYHGTFIK